MVLVERSTACIKRGVPPQQIFYHLVALLWPKLTISPETKDAWVLCFAILRTGTKAGTFVEGFVQAIHVPSIPKMRTYHFKLPSGGAAKMESVVSPEYETAQLQRMIHYLLVNMLTTNDILRSSVISQFSKGLTALSGFIAPIIVSTFAAVVGIWKNGILCVGSLDIVKQPKWLACKLPSVAEHANSIVFSKGAVV